MLFKKKVEVKTYDKTQKKPVLKTNIYTGEKIAGFKDLKTGKFEEVCLITDNKDIKAFMKEYSVKEEDLREEY